MVRNEMSNVLLSFIFDKFSLTSCNFYKQNYFDYSYVERNINDTFWVVLTDLTWSLQVRVVSFSMSVEKGSLDLKLLSS